MAGVVARGVRVAFGKLRNLGEGDSSATYLATRRLAAAPGSIVGLLIASILSVGILVYAQSLAETITTSTEAKAGVFVGSDVELLVYATAEIPDDFPVPATKVRKIMRLSMTNGAQFAMLGVDRDTFERAAFWDTSFGDRPLSELLDSIDPRPGEPLPVLVVAGETIESEPAIDLATDIPLNVAHRIRAFPGMPADQALIVADIEGMNELFRGAASSASANAEDLIWARGSLNGVLGAAADAHISVGLFNSKEQVLARPTLSSVTWAFDLLRALGLASGAIALLAVLLYMQARQRSTSVAYAMARRMGLSPRQHALALGIELAAILAVAAVAGTLLATGVARLLYKYLDLLNTIPPDPLLRIPSTVIIGIFGVAVLAAVVGSMLVQRGADRARIAEVLRLAE
jgi:putative ABC transport system permease protein